MQGTAPSPRTAISNCRYLEISTRRGPKSIDSVRVLIYHRCHYSMAGQHRPGLHLVLYSTLRRPRTTVCNPAPPAHTQNNKLPSIRHTRFDPPTRWPCVGRGACMSGPLTWVTAMPVALPRSARAKATSHPTNPPPRTVTRFTDGLSCHRQPTTHPDQTRPRHGKAYPKPTHEKNDMIKVVRQRTHGRARARGGQTSQLSDEALSKKQKIYRDMYVVEVHVEFELEGDARRRSIVPTAAACMPSERIDPPPPPPTYIQGVGVT